MDTRRKPAKEQADVPDDLITERDIDEDFGLFQEGSYPGALPDEDQEAALKHAVPKEGQT
ncbi:hypothetical protein [Paenibacillus sp. MMS20-IR301]|uniref:hypothetical protein n=1 Tax=Paenibacillus sp. MMS20-IR301 TaxID=2895946 RepID=UPI0028EFBAD7|nr:hypothetical protein [Paenibacillus sp. MMS20-IR301]WNS41294.1 hypothetical protein LOS79_19905 [Paenibacillus sp. MMS20-IR301]